MTPNFTFDGHTNNCLTVLACAFPDNATIVGEVTAFRALSKRTRLRLATAEDIRNRVHERAYVLGFKKTAVAGSGRAFGLAFVNGHSCIVFRTHEKWWGVAPQGVLKVGNDDITAAWSVPDARS